MKNVWHSALKKIIGYTLLYRRSEPGTLAWASCFYLATKLSCCKLLVSLLEQQGLRVISLSQTTGWRSQLSTETCVSTIKSSSSFPPLLEMEQFCYWECSKCPVCVSVCDTDWGHTAFASVCDN